mmetsp:Transcript_18083/g.37669  ORF Transcript_18083/g.37669 Transcript_18083/m.37669 type:complete len:270 (-) Transcript_18083:537-1346(-)
MWNFASNHIIARVRRKARVAIPANPLRLPGILLSDSKIACCGPASASMPPIFSVIFWALCPWGLPLIGAALRIPTWPAHCDTITPGRRLHGLCSSICSRRSLSWRARAMKAFTVHNRKRRSLDPPPSPLRKCTMQRKKRAWQTRSGSTDLRTHTGIIESRAPAKRTTHGTMARNQATRRTMYRSKKTLDMPFIPSGQESRFRNFRWSSAIVNHSKACPAPTLKTKPETDSAAIADARNPWKPCIAIVVTVAKRPRQSATIHPKLNRNVM